MRRGRAGQQTLGGSTELLEEAPPHTRMNPSKARLVVVSGPSKGRFVELLERELVVGNDPDCDLVLEDSSVSRQHLGAKRAGAFALIRDLGSTNGTFLGEVRVHEVQVSFGAELLLGRTVLRYAPAEEALSLSPSSEPAFGALLGEDPKMREVFALLANVAATEATLIIEGETGTGKELAAQAIHAHSRRASGPFEVFDCSSVPETLIESALFGHKKGAFTGATQSRQGAFERASGGTLFLDEIGELSLTLQPKLLRVLEARQVQKVGGEAYVPVDVRILCATHRSLRAEVRQGRFRQDLYYRLAVVKLVLPALRARLGDLPLLSRAFLQGFGASPEQLEAILSVENVRCMNAHLWPGNVRELRNLMERALALGSGPHIDIAAFLAEGAADAQPAQERLGLGRDDHGEPLPFKDAKNSLVASFEKSYLEDMLRRSGGNISGAAREAGIDRKHFRELMKKHGLV